MFSSTGHYAKNSNFTIRINGCVVGVISIFTAKNKIKKGKHSLSVLILYFLTQGLLFNFWHIYIYIVINRQTVSFYQNSSVWLDRLDS